MGSDKRKKTVYNQIEVDCAVCVCGSKVKKTNARHVKTEKHRKGVEGGGDGKVGGDMEGAGGGQNSPSEIQTTRSTVGRWPCVF